MSADMYEGCLYNLPEVLTWESVSNMEELTLVEINSMAGKSVVPMETFLKAIRMFNMAKRAEEEESLLNEELSNVADFYTKEHLYTTTFLHCYCRGSYCIPTWLS